MILFKQIKLLILLILAVTTTNLNAQKVSLPVAISAAETFANSQCITEPITGIRRVHTIESIDNNINLYKIYTKIGWVLVAADLRVQPILAYSFENNTELEETIEGYQDMLELYSSQVSYARVNISTDSIHPQWISFFSDSIITLPMPNINPLLYWDGDSLCWGQSGRTSNGGYTYNRYCPAIYGTDSCEHAKVGCVATAMGQVMRYWQWPQNAIVRDDAGNDVYREYDWSLMPCRLNENSTEVQINQIATLLHDAGVSVNMNYGCNGSGAATGNIPNAIRNTYGYISEDLISKENNSYTYTNEEWQELLKNELLYGKPVIYRASRASTGGHAFIIDGFDSSNYFHVNFGWHGSQNGFYSLDNLNGYNSGQSAIFGLEPRVRHFELSSDSLYLSCDEQTVRVNRQSTQCGLVWGHSAGIDITIHGDSAAIASDGTTQTDRWVSAALYDSVMNRIVISDTIHFTFSEAISNTGIEIMQQQISVMYDYSLRKQYLLHFKSTGGDNKNVYYWSNVDASSSSGNIPTYTGSCNLQSAGNVVSFLNVPRCPYNDWTPPVMLTDVEDVINAMGDENEQDRIITPVFIRPDEIVYTYTDPTYALVTLPVGSSYSGSVFVTAYDGCCHTTSGSISVSNILTPIYSASSPENMNVTSTTTSSEFTVYPNPVDDAINISWEASAFQTGNALIFSLYSQYGLQVQLNASVNAENLTIPTSSLPAGTYILNIQQNSVFLQRQIVRINHD